MVTVFGQKPRLPITEQAVRGLQTVRDVALPRPANDEEAMKMGLIPLKGPSGQTTYFDPMGGAGTVRRAGGQAIKAAVREIEPSVVQIVNHLTNETSFLRIPKGKLRDFHALIDDTKSGIAGMPDAQGNIYHITAKSPEQMMSRGFKDMGVADTKAIPRLVQMHSRTNAPEVRQYVRQSRATPAQSRPMSNFGSGG